MYQIAISSNLIGCQLWDSLHDFPAGIYLLKVNNTNTTTIQQYNTTIQHARRRSSVFIVNFEHISHLVLMFLLLTLNM